MMTASFAGSLSYTANVNMNQGGGNKKQGLPGITNMRSSLVFSINQRAYGDQESRDKVFYINQLSNIGGKSTMFSPSADGVNLTGFSPLFNFNSYSDLLSNSDNYVNVRMDNLQDKYSIFSYKYSNTVPYYAVLRIQFNRIMTIAEIEIVKKELEKTTSSVDIFFNQQTSTDGALGEGVDINCTYLVWQIDSEDSISINLAPDLVYIELELITDIFDGATYYAETYGVYEFRYYFKNKEIQNPLVRNNKSILGHLQDSNPNYKYFSNIELLPETSYSVALNYSENNQNIDIYKPASSVGMVESGKSDDGGCTIGYIVSNNVPTNGYENDVFYIEDIGLPVIDNKLNKYNLIVSKIKKTFLDKIFDPYTDNTVTSTSNGNYFSISFSLASGEQSTEITPNHGYNYGVSLLMVRKLADVNNGYDEDGNAYVYFTTEDDLYKNALYTCYGNNRSLELTNNCPPVITPTSMPTGFLLCNNYDETYQAGSIIRIRNGNFSNDEALKAYYSSPCYSKVEEMTPLTKEELDWVSMTANTTD